MRSWKDGDRTFYELSGPSVEQWQPNEGVYEDTPEGIEGIVRKRSGNKATIELLRDYRSERHNVWGISPAIASRTLRSICSWTRKSTS